MNTKNETDVYFTVGRGHFLSRGYLKQPVNILNVMVEVLCVQKGTRALLLEVCNSCGFLFIIYKHGYFNADFD